MNEGEVMSLTLLCSQQGPTGPAGPKGEFGFPGRPVSTMNSPTSGHKYSSDRLYNATFLDFLVGCVGA